MAQHREGHRGVLAGYKRLQRVLDALQDLRVGDEKGQVGSSISDRCAVNTVQEKQ